MISQIVMHCLIMFFTSVFCDDGGAMVTDKVCTN